MKRLEKTFGSKRLIQFQSRLGISICYVEVQRFKQSTAENNETRQHTEQVSADCFLQWISDYMDTTTGHGTFHGLGGVMVGDTQNIAIARIPRIK